RWMLALSAPRVHAVNAHYYRKLELDAKTFTQSRSVIERALRGGKHLTRVELASVLRKAGISAKGPRLAYLMMHAELEAAICSGARRGKQFTYALLDERVPRARTMKRDDALAELTRRYFSSRAPATLRDYVWWSGLTVREARIGIDLLKPLLAEEMVRGRTYLCIPSAAGKRHDSRAVYLLPNYDELGIAYKDRDVIPEVRRPPLLSARDEFPHLLLIDGHPVGRWRRTIKGGTVVVEVQPFKSLDASERRSLDIAAARHGRFMNMPVTVSSVDGRPRHRTA
ncbi:MAG: winged helix DNA-binding domain-containing protein, partial [Vicinamibacterales bacterium]